jgi:hypothetical protein
VGIGVSRPAATGDSGSGNIDLAPFSCEDLGRRSRVLAGLSAAVANKRGTTGYPFWCNSPDARAFAYVEVVLRFSHTAHRQQS